MIKVLDKALEKKFAGIVGDKNAPKIIKVLKELQDGSGLKVCQNVTKGDPAYRKV